MAILGSYDTTPSFEAGRILRRAPWALEVECSGLSSLVHHVLLKAEPGFRISHPTTKPVGDNMEEEAPSDSCSSIWVQLLQHRAEKQYQASLSSNV